MGCWATTIEYRSHITHIWLQIFFRFCSHMLLRELQKASGGKLTLLQSTSGFKTESSYFLSIENNSLSLPMCEELSHPVTLLSWSSDCCVVSETLPHFKWWCAKQLHVIPTLCPIHLIIYNVLLFVLWTMTFECYLIIWLVFHSTESSACIIREQTPSKALYQ